MVSQPAHYDRETNVLIYTDRCSIQKGFRMIYYCMLLYLECLIHKSMCRALNYRVSLLTEDRNSTVSSFLSEVMPEDARSRCCILIKLIQSDLSYNFQQYVNVQCTDNTTSINICLSAMYLLLISALCSAVISEKGKMCCQCTRHHTPVLVVGLLKATSSSQFQRPP